MRLAFGCMVVMLGTAAVGEEVPAAGAEVAAVVEQAGRPEHELALEANLGAMVQRFGALLDVRGRYRRRLYQSADEAFSDNYVGLSLINQVAPILVHTGVQLELAPTSFLRLNAGYQFIGYFGAMNTLRTFTGCEGAQGLAADDPACDFNPGGVQDPGRTGVGHRLYLEGIVQVKLGPILAIGGGRLERWWMQPGGDDTGADDFWLNELYALPQRRADTVFAGGGAVLYEILKDGPGRPQLLAGAASDLAWVHGADYLKHQVGPVVMLRIPKWRSVRELIVSAAVQFYTHERYLVGQVPFIGLSVSAATPNLLAGALAPAPR